MKVNGTNICFDRVMRVTIIFSGNPFAGKNVSADTTANLTSSGGKYFLTIEYNPRDDSRKIARIDCKCESMMALTSVDRPSYLAEVKLYNITDDIANAIANYGTILNKIWGNNNITRFGTRLISESDKAKMNSIATKSWASLRSSVPQIQIEWAYYGDSEWNNLFKGYIQSSFSERQGEDYVTTIQCWEYSSEIPSNSTDSYLGTADSYNGIPDGETIDGTFFEVAKEIICKYEVEAPTVKDQTGVVNLSSFLSTSKTTAKQTTFRTASTEKNNRKIYGSSLISKAVKSSNSLELDNDLQSELSSLDVSFNTNGETNVTSLLKSLCSQVYLKDSNQLAVRIDRSMTKDSKFYYVFYKVGRHVSTSKKEIIEIVNYKNVVVQPQIQGNGSLVVKTMLIPGATRFNTLRLTYEPEEGNDDSTSFNALPTVAYAGSTGNYQPIMAGIYNATLLQQDVKNKGCIFDSNFTIWKIVYELSTHGKEWYNTFYTMPTFAGSGI